MGLKGILHLLIISQIFVAAYCQDHKNSLITGVKPHVGFIVKHSGKLEGLTKSFPWGLEIETRWQLMSEKSWQYCFCYPYTGISLFYTSFANKYVLGSAFALYPFVEPAINGDKMVHTSIRFGMGPVYLTNVFDSVSNPENQFYSSHLSFIVHLDVALNFRINEKINTKLSAEFNHISNGGIKNPNLGINFPGVSLGIDYNLRPLPYSIRTKDRSVRLVPYLNRFDFILLGTGKTAVKGSERYPVYGLSVGYSRVIGRQDALISGLEFIFDQAEAEEIEKRSTLYGTEPVDHKYLAFFAGHELILGRFNFYQQLGVYLYVPFKRRDPVFQRYGLNFSLSEHFFVGINLKAHRQVADFLDFRIGFSP